MFLSSSFPWRQSNCLDSNIHCMWSKILLYKRKPTWTINTKMKCAETKDLVYPYNSCIQKHQRKWFTALFCPLVLRPSLQTIHSWNCLFGIARDLFQDDYIHIWTKASFQSLCLIVCPNMWSWALTKLWVISKCLYYMPTAIKVFGTSYLF